MFQCLSYAKTSHTPSLLRLSFRVDTSDLPDKQICGKSTEECSEAGFRGFIKKSEETENYINYPVLVAKDCLPIALSDDFLEIRLGIIPHLDKASLSMKEAQGKEPLRLRTYAFINAVNGLYTEYKKGETVYFTDCEMAYEEYAIIEGEIPVLSYGKPIDNCN